MSNFPAELKGIFIADFGNFCVFSKGILIENFDQKFKKTSQFSIAEKEFLEKFVDVLGKKTVKLCEFLPFYSYFSENTSVIYRTIGFKCYA